MHRNMPYVRLHFVESQKNGVEENKDSLKEIEMSPIMNYVHLYDIHGVDR